MRVVQPTRTWRCQTYKRREIRVKGLPPFFAIVTKAAEKSSSGSGRFFGRGGKRVYPLMIQVNIARVKYAAAGLRLVDARLGRITRPASDYRDLFFRQLASKHGQPLRRSPAQQMTLLPPGTAFVDAATHADGQQVTVPTIRIHQIDSLEHRLYEIPAGSDCLDRVVDNVATCPVTEPNVLPTGFHFTRWLDNERVRDVSRACAVSVSGLWVGVRYKAPSYRSWELLTLDESL